MIGRRSGVERAAFASHVESLLRAYRNQSVEMLRALPTHESLPEFRAGDRVWGVYTDAANLDDGGVSFGIVAWRESWFGRWTWADGFVMDASGMTRDLTGEERRDLT